MDIEDHQSSIGWPLGLEVMTLRVGVIESLQNSSMGAQLLGIRSASFSSISSSALDTQSSASFFKDSSTSLGRLIGIKPGNEVHGRLYFTDSSCYEEPLLVSAGAGEERSESSRGSRVDSSQGICIPLLLNILVRRSKNKSKGTMND